MIIKITDFTHPYNKPEGLTPLKIWISPDKHYAVAEVIFAEFFVAGQITQYDESQEVMTVKYCSDVRTDTDEIDYHSYTVDWSNLPYGFCKLLSGSLESREQRSFRLYFDEDLYKRKYEELNGVPYSGNKSFGK